MVFNKIASKVHTDEENWQTAKKVVADWQTNGETVVFTNGCFDILHYGHLHYLAAAADLGTKLIIGLNSAASVKRLKGNHRPINDDLTRRFTLASLSFVDLVVDFEEDTPFELIHTLMPNILVKGGDYEIDTIVGADIILENGGKVEVLPFVKGYSTTNIEDKIKNS